MESHPRSCEQEGSQPQPGFRKITLQELGRGYLSSGCCEAEGCRSHGCTGSLLSAGNNQALVVDWGGGVQAKIQDMLVLGSDV